MIRLEDDGGIRISKNTVVVGVNSGLGSDREKDKLDAHSLIRMQLRENGCVLESELDWYGNHRDDKRDGYVQDAQAAYNTALLEYAFLVRNDSLVRKLVMDGNTTLVSSLKKVANKGETG